VTRYLSNTKTNIIIKTLIGYTIMIALMRFMKFMSDDKKIITYNLL